MGQINTTTHRQYVSRPEKEEITERYKVVSVKEDELYVSMVDVEDEETENFYDPDCRGWEYGYGINESKLPVKHIEKLSDIREKLSSNESISSETEMGKISM